MEDRFQKLFIALRYYLLGADYIKALKAFDFARRIHTGTRKDGKTPEFQHQVEIALYLTTLKDVIDEERCIAAALLHDTLEDYDTVKREDIYSITDEKVADACVLLNKNGKKPENYFGDISNDHIASLVKGSDRVHNVNSMKGVFSVEKQKEYIGEVEQWFLPMLKNARNRFPEQTRAYFNVEHMLRSQINFLKD
jgi:(p)ppGpp synthase/HD superfamily hydrolase